MFCYTYFNISQYYLLHLFTFTCIKATKIIDKKDIYNVITYLKTDDNNNNISNDINTHWNYFVIYNIDRNEDYL